MLVLVAYVAAVGVLLLIVGKRLMERAKDVAAHPQQQIASRKHDGPVASLSELKGTGTIYLVQMGEHKAPYQVEDFATWLREKYKLDVQVLPPSPIDLSAWNGLRREYVAEDISEQMKRDHPDLAANRNAYLIGFTDDLMYTEHFQWNSTFTQRDSERAAVISADGMEDEWQVRGSIDPKIANAHLKTRLQRILLKDVALLYWHLPLNDDQSSLLHNTLDPDEPNEDIFESDLDPARSVAGQNVDEPCVFVEYSAAQGIKPMAGPMIRGCGQVEDPDEDVGVERFELDLRLGLLIDKRTDLYLPDTIPIRFQRVTRDGWKGINPFGISGTDNYDEFLSSPDNITISVVQADGGREELVREPRGLAVLSLVKYVDTEKPGFYEMRWKALPFEHYDVKRFDGAVKTYLPCDGPTVWCYLTDLHNPQGQELRFERGIKRRLMRLTSPHDRSVAVSYDLLGRIDQVTDSTGRTVRYGYDALNRLTSVTYPSGEVSRYAYDATQHLLEFSVAPNAHSAPRVLMQNEYANGLLVKETLADGSVYQYSYDRAGNGQIAGATVQSRDGRVFHLKASGSEWVVHEGGGRQSSPGGAPAAK
jgi:YD repeat-containing protein